MNVQLTLIDSTDTATASLWQIDDETKEIGLAGLRQAREALAEARSALVLVAEDTNNDVAEVADDEIFVAASDETKLAEAA